MTGVNIKYTKKEAKFLEFFLQKTLHPEAKRCASFTDEGSANEAFFSIVLPHSQRTISTLNKISKLLEPKKGYNYLDAGATDVVVFHDTFFGEVCIYFTPDR